MKKFFYLILTFSMLVYLNPVKAQSYGFEMKLDNFKQVSEYEFQFESFIRKISGTDNIAIDVFQFQVQYSPNILNGGTIDNANITFDNSGSGLVGNVKTGDFKSISGNRLLFVSGDAGTSGSVVTVLTDTWLKIGVFSVKLSTVADISKFLNFGSAAPVFGFRSDASLIYTSLTRCNFTGTAPGPYYKSGTSIFPVSTRTLTPEHGVAMNLRQLAGFWYYGDGDWDVATNWNQTLKVVNPDYVQTLPGLNSNAIINGNLIIPDGVDASLLPNGGNNGGELTVLTGSEPLYTLTVSTNFPAVLFVRIRENAPNSTWLTAQLNTATISLPANYVVRLYTYDLIGDYSFVNWTSTGGSFTSNIQSGAVFTMPASNVTATANWAFSKSGFSSSQVGIDELNRNLENEGDAVYSDVSSIGNFKDGYRSLWSSLTIVPGSSLTVDKLYNDNSNGAAAIVVKSDANGTGYLIHNNTGVLATIERYLAQTIYHYVSSPITNAPYALFQSPPPLPTGYADFFEWNEVTKLWNNLNFGTPPPNGVMLPGKGYAVAYSLDNYTKNFVGEINVGTVPFQATNTPLNPGNYIGTGFNLVGNPYPCALAAKDTLTAIGFFNTNPSVSGLYFWDEADTYIGYRDDYATYSLAGGTKGGAESRRPNAVIAPMQGFMVKVNADSDLEFNNNMRFTESSSFYKEEGNLDRIWLSVKGPELDYNEILVAFMEGAQVGLDRTDGEKLKGNSKLAFYSTIESGDYAIQGLPSIISTDTYEIPLGVDAGFSGQYTFDVQKIENFVSGTAITLEDRLAGKMINLRTNPQYIAQIATPGEVRGRFYLHFNGPTAVPVIEQKLTKVYAINNQIFIELAGNNKILDVEVLNTLGQSVLRTTVNATEATINVNGSNVVYIVKVRTSQGVESHKILLH